MSDLKVVEATLNISVNVNCPHCDFYIYLLWYKDTNGINIDDDSHVMNQACPISGEIWIDAHKKFEIERVECGECKKPFTVKKLEW